jgi:hypothetical protein
MSTRTRGSDQHGLLQAAVDLVVDRARSVVELVGAAGSGAVSALPEPVPGAVTRLLTSLRDLVDQMPTVNAEVDVIVHELHAKRLSIQALQAELAALDQQLELLERSLAPLEAWSNQWNRMRTSLVDTLGGTDDT